MGVGEIGFKKLTDLSKLEKGKLNPTICLDALTHF